MHIKGLDVCKAHQWQKDLRDFQYLEQHWGT